MGWRSVDHTGDLAVGFWADDEAGLLRAAGEAVMALLTEGATPTAGDERAITLRCLDAEDRLVQWVNELLYLATTQGFVYADADLQLEGTDLAAVVRGQADAFELLCDEIKSATYHDLHLSRGLDGVRTLLVLDV